MRKTFLNIFAMILLPSMLFAGAWTQKQNGGYFRLDFRWLNADKYHAANGDNINIPTLGDYTFSFYGEYGLTDWLTIQSYIPFYKIVNSETKILSEDENTGFGDVSFGVKLLLKKFNQSVLSAGVAVGLPFGDSSPMGGLILGDGEFNQIVSVQYGQSLYPLPAYYNAAIKYNNRTEEFSDELFLTGEFGYSFNNKFSAALKAVYLKSLKNGSEKVFGGYAGLYGNNQEYITVTPELIYKLSSNFGVAANMGLGLTAKNIMNAVVYSVGVYFSK